MTNKEFREKIDRLKAELAELGEKVEAMNRVGSGGVFKPEYKQKYWLTSGAGEISEDEWDDAWLDERRYAMGNCYPTREAVEDTIRVLKLIQKARGSQGGFVPDWEDETQYKYSLIFKFGNIIIENCRLINTASIFGYWRDKSACGEFASDNYKELVWFFKEYQR